MFKALKTFSGKISMVEGEIKEILDKEVAKDLLNAKYVEEVKAAKKAAKKAPKGE